MAMTTLHTAVGIAIVKAIPEPTISFPLVLLSHILLDLYPEWYDKQNRISNLSNILKVKFDWKEKTLGITQLFLLVLICWYLFSEQNIYLLAGAVLANIFDLVETFYMILRKRGFFFFHPNGWWPFKITFSWQGFGMAPLQNSVLDIIFVTLLLFS